MYKRIHLHVQRSLYVQYLVDFGLHVGPGAETLIESSTEKIYASLIDVVYYQTQYRHNEAKGKHAADGLNSTVQLWSVVQSLVVVVTGFGQVFVLRRFFSDSRRPPTLTSILTSGLDPGVRVGSVAPLKGV